MGCGNCYWPLRKASLVGRGILWSWEIHSGGKCVGDGTMVEVSHRFYKIDKHEQNYFLYCKSIILATWKIKEKLKIKFIYR